MFSPLSAEQLRGTCSTGGERRANPANRGGKIYFACRAGLAPSQPSVWNQYRLRAAQM